MFSHQLFKSDCFACLLQKLREEAILEVIQSGCDPKGLEVFLVWSYVQLLGVNSSLVSFQ